MIDPINPIALLASAGLTAVGDPLRMNGADAAVWRIETTERTVAVRVLPKGRGVEGEVRAQERAAGLGVPAPRVIAHGTLDGRPYTITTWMPGRVLGEALLSGGDPWQAGVLLGRAMAALHMPAGDGSVLCHGDFHPLNVLVDGGRVTGVVDWANARDGDPREDIATTRVVLQFAPALIPEFGAIADAVADGFGAGYAETRSLPSEDELRPFARLAARRQADAWGERAARGAATENVARAAGDVVARWS